MEPQEIQPWIEGGSLIGVLAYIVVSQWRRRNGDEPATRHQVHSLVTEVRDLAKALHEHTEDVNAYHRAGERMARERHEEIMEAARKRSA